VDNEDFREEITLKLYLKYVYDSVLTGPKTTEKESILKNIKRNSFDYLYGENPLKKRGYCFFCPKKGVLKHQKDQKSTNYL
jgi:hypothetical protein